MNERSKIMHQEPWTHNRFIFPSIIMGLAIIIAVATFSFTWKGVKSENQTINVTGSARKSIVSDLGILRISVNVDEVNQVSAYQRLKSQVPMLVNYLLGKGFEKSRMNTLVMNIYPNFLYNDAGHQIGIRSFTGTQTIEVQSADVNLIKNASIDVVSLLEKGISVTVNPPEYYYTKLSAIKIDIQADAAKDAMIRGRRIAEATGRKLGVLTNARMGVLQITPENSNITSDYGVNDVSSIRKEITAVVNANFLIR